MKYRLLLTLSMVTCASQAMESALQKALKSPLRKNKSGNTALHANAKDNNYPTCKSMLLTLDGLVDITKFAKFPIDENAQERLIKMATYPEEQWKDAGITDSKQAKKQRKKAAKKLSAYLATMHKFQTAAVTKARAMKAALNRELQTPVGCARQAKASDQLLELLDPKNNIVIGKAVADFFFTQEQWKVFNAAHNLG